MKIEIRRIQSRLFNPQYWGLGFYLWVLAILGSINLFGPKGMLHWILLRQEAVRVQHVQSGVQQEIADLEEQIRRFRGSTLAKERAIREELGYLQPDEVSVELLNADASDNP